MEKREGIFPRNTRQIGEPGQGARVFIEDYVYTYLRQLAGDELTCMRTAALLGRRDTSGIYIQGALEADMGQERGKWFSNENWSGIFRNVQIWFDGLEVLGWYLSNPGFPVTLTDELKSLHRRHFPGQDTLFFLTDILENEETIFRQGENGLAPLPGYYIYYEKNEQMQAYISRQHGGLSIEPEGVLTDRAAVRFRSAMQEKKEKNSQKRLMTVLYTACTFLVMVILVIGVTMINNYDRMTSMESALYRISESLDEETGEDMEQAVQEENRLAAEEAVMEEAQTEEALSEAVTSQAEEGQEDAEAATEEGEETSQENSVAAQEDSTEETDVDTTAATEPERYLVQAGDTLLGICRAKYGGDERLDEICELNGLDDSDKIYVGQTIVLP
ncbi:MAG: LysM peptidoglycan-binding domain-containing protein [Lachnospiraceae bacterium]|nr:LysM peptidoglycan-binding domain-containing protein [Lachnospiraceae bacterium]